MPSASSSSAVRRASDLRAGAAAALPARRPAHARRHHAAVAGDRLRRRGFVDPLRRRPRRHVHRPRDGAGGRRTAFRNARRPRGLALARRLARPAALAFTSPARRCCSITACAPSSAQLFEVDARAEVLARSRILRPVRRAGRGAALPHGDHDFILDRLAAAPPVNEKPDSQRRSPLPQSLPDPGPCRRCSSAAPTSPFTTENTP